MPEFSIIVPVYKTEKYIGRCVESIRVQTFEDFELILINDGSPDECGKICEQYAEVDKRICVIHQENKGVSEARNTGIDKAKGKYIVFVDSDDEIEKNYLACMAAVNEKVDLVVCGMKFLTQEGVVYDGRGYKEEFISKIRCQEVLEMIDRKAINYPWDKRFHRSLINKEKIYFEKSMNLAEDTCFVAKYLGVCESVKYVSEMPYLYYKYKKGTLSSFNENTLPKLLTANKSLLHILESKFGNISHENIWMQREFNVLYYTIFNVLESNEYNFKKKYYMLKDILDREEVKKYLPKLDIFMKNDSKWLRMIISSKKPGVLLIFREIHNMKKKIKRLIWASK